MVILEIGNCGVDYNDGGGVGCEEKRGERHFGDYCGIIGADQATVHF